MSEKIYQQLELILQWEGKLNAKHLENLLGVTRQTASKKINEYIALHTASLAYNNSAKTYQPTEQFTPQYGPCLLDDYLALNQTTDNAHTSQLKPGSNTLHLGSVHAQPKPEYMRAIFTAIEQKQRIDIGYASVSSPDFEERIISPHSLVYDGHRWHTRAWCEKNLAFRDFVLSRINNVIELEGAAEKTSQDDTAWNTWVSFDIQPEPRLSQAKQTIIALDYGMDVTTNHPTKTLTVRAATILYWLAYLRQDQQHDIPEAQQIVISPNSQKELKKWLPEGYWQN